MRPWRPIVHLSGQEGLELWVSTRPLQVVDCLDGHNLMDAHLQYGGDDADLHFRVLGHILEGTPSDVLCAVSSMIETSCGLVIQATKEEGRRWFLLQTLSPSMIHLWLPHVCGGLWATCRKTPPLARPTWCTF